mgnify:CR=1 FL=1
MTDSVKVAPRFGRILTVVVGVVGVAMIVSGWSGGPGAVLRTIAPVTLLVAATWAAFWRPAVIVDQDAVTVRNVFSTEVIPFENIRRIDTRYALTLETTSGKVSAWAAPAPGRHRVLTAGRTEANYLPESTYLAGTVRPGDLITSDSGVAAAVIRRRWEELRGEGSIGDGPATKRAPRWRCSSP